MSTAAEPRWVNPAQHKGYTGRKCSPSRRKKLVEKNLHFEGGDSLFKRTFWCLAPNARLSGKRGGDGKLAVVMVGTQNRVSAVKGFWQDRNTGVNATAAKSQHSTFPLLRMWCPNRTSPPQGSSVLWSVTPEALKSYYLTRPGHLHFWSSILQYHCITVAV